MTKKTVQVLAALVVGLLLLLLFVERTEREPATADGEPLLPGLESRAGDIERIEIDGPGEDDTVTIVRANDAWVVESRRAYPADVGKLRQLVAGFVEAQIVEEKTANPDNYALLGVADPGSDGAGTQVTLAGSDFSYAAIIGDAAQGGFRYARVPAQATSYLVDQAIELPVDAGDWLAAELLDIAADEIRSVRIEHADGETVVISKSDREQTDFVVNDIPAGRTLSYATVANAIARTLEDLTLDDVRQDADVTSESTATFETWDGLVVTASSASVDDETVVRFAARAEGDEAPEDRANEINGRVDGWWFVIPAHKAELLQRRWDDLLSEEDGE